MLPSVKTGFKSKFKHCLEKIPDFFQSLSKISGIPEKRNKCIKKEDSSLQQTVILFLLVLNYTIALSGLTKSHNTAPAMPETAVTAKAACQP